MIAVRGTFLALDFMSVPLLVSGFSFGIGLTYPLAGFLIAHGGWEVVFYTTGSLGAFWCIFWYLFAFDSPQKHPRISKQELEYIQANMGSVCQGGQVRSLLNWMDKLSTQVNTG